MSSSEPAPEPGAAAARRGRVLIVEDDHDLRELLRVLLRSEGYTPVAAPDAHAALAALATAAVDVIVCDLMLPRMTGTQFCERLQQDATHRAIPFILITALPADIVPERERYAAVLHKPFDIDHLLAAVSNAVGASTS